MTERRHATVTQLCVRDKADQLEAVPIRVFEMDTRFCPAHTHTNDSGSVNNPAVCSRLDVRILSAEEPCQARKTQGCLNLTGSVNKEAC